MTVSHRLKIALASIALGSVALQAAAAQAGDAGRGAEIFRERCALCHISAGEGGQGPNLNGVLGRKAGATGFSYSSALKGTGWTWDAARLSQYLEDPQAAAPGTSMPLAVPDSTERNDLIAYLGTLQARPAQARSQGEKPASDSSVFGDWTKDRPRLRHHITLDDIPPPYETESAGNPPRIVSRPPNAKLQVPDGFDVQLFASGLRDPRIIRTAPNGDLFVAESDAGRVRVLRPASDGKGAARTEIFAQKLRGPFGIAFYPNQGEPKWVYIAETNRVIRFPYQSGDLKARSAPEIVVPKLSPTAGGHITRDLAFSNDGKRMFVSVGSASNDAEGLRPKSPEEIKRWEAERGLGAAWGYEENRANVLVFTPEGEDARIFATGLRNCVGLAIHPTTGEVYCSTNERDELGDNLVPDYVTRVREGGFYGWPWWYMGNHEDPNWKGVRPDLAGKTETPDVLLQPHSASLGMAFYTSETFPPGFKDSAFAAFHGSWNRTRRTGYKVVRIIMHDGVPTGEYEDFLTGFVIDNARVWGRPVGVTAGKDGALFVTEDGNGTIWRVTYNGPAASGR